MGSSASAYYDQLEIERAVYRENQYGKFLEGLNNASFVEIQGELKDIHFQLDNLMFDLTVSRDQHRKAERMLDKLKKLKDVF